MRCGGLRRALDFRPYATTMPRCRRRRGLALYSKLVDLTPYDAVYFDLARRRKLPLATLDAALVNAARAAKLPLITDLSIFLER